MDTQEEEIGNLAECLIEQTNQKGENVEDPMDEYAYELKKRLLGDAKTFRNRFIRGFLVLFHDEK